MRRVCENSLRPGAARQEKGFAHQYQLHHLNNARMYARLLVYSLLLCSPVGFVSMTVDIYVMSASKDTRFLKAEIHGGNQNLNCDT